jgi:putative Mn2+ efflux pump MntP
MDPLLILTVAFILALDCFAVALAAGTTLAAGRFRAGAMIGSVFGLFQAFMAILGWLSGTFLSIFISSYAPGVAFLILVIIGIHMIWEGFGTGTAESKDYLSPTLLLLLAVATSLDAMGVGLSFALLSTAILFPAIIIGMMSGILSFIGVIIGSRVAQRFGKYIEAAGGVVLILLGVRMVTVHIFLK